MTNESPHGFPYSFLRGLRSAMSFRFAAQLWSRWRRLLGGFSSNGWVETVKKSFWGVKKQFQFSRCVVPFSFPEFYLGLHFTMAIQCWPVATWHRSVDSMLNGRRTMRPCSVFFVFIQVGKSKSWNAKGDQFPKNIWVLICQIHLLRYPAFQPNPYPEHCKTTWHPAASLCKVGLAPLRDCRLGSFIPLTTDGCNGRLWATLWTLSKWKALV